MDTIEILIDKGVKLTREEMIAHISEEAKIRFHIGLERGSLKVELYVPRGEDLQTPHEQDECYIVTRGNGQFVMGEETVDFKPCDFLFVPAGIPHRFINFGDEMEAWVIFYGPQGGEGNRKNQNVR